MGVPVITLPGKRPISRQTTAFLALIGMSEWIAKDEANYLQIAQGLAADPERLQKYRVSLRERMRQSPLCDARQFASDWASTLLTLEPRS